MMTQTVIKTLPLLNENLTLTDHDDANFPRKQRTDQWAHSLISYQSPIRQPTESPRASSCSVQECYSSLRRILVEFFQRCSALASTCMDLNNYALYVELLSTLILAYSAVG